MKNLFFVLLPLMAVLLSASSENHFKSGDDNYLLIVKPRKETVSAGTKYEAEVFLYNTPKESPVIFFEGRQLPVDSNGIGILSFTATPGAFDRDGISKKQFKLSATVQSKGKEISVMNMQEYRVQKPVIEIEGMFKNVLYKNCGNEIDVQVPSLENTYNPSFRAEGAMLIAGSKRGKVTVVPTGAKVILHISNNGNLVGMQEFQVQKVPQPEMILYSDSLKVDLRKGIKISELGTVKVSVKPDAFFLSNFPKDSRFKIMEVQTSLMRWNGELDTLSFSQSQLDLSGYKSKAQKGDRIVVEIKKIGRANFMNKMEVTEPEEIITIPLY